MKIIISCGGAFCVMLGQRCCHFSSSPAFQGADVDSEILYEGRRRTGTSRVQLPLGYPSPAPRQACNAAKLPTDKGSLHPANRNSQLISTVRTVTISISLLAADLNMSRPQHPVQYNTTVQYHSSSSRPVQSSPSSSFRSFFFGSQARQDQVFGVCTSMSAYLSHGPTADFPITPTSLSLHHHPSPSLLF